MANNIHDQDDDGTIDGTAQSDVIYGGTSNGNANGGAVVNDTIDGGQSDDTIYAGDGDDLIFGGDAGDAAGGGSGAKRVEEFQFDLDNADPVDEGNGDGNIGDSILYRNVATADDGTPISVRITIVNQSDDDLDIELGRSDNYPIFLEGGEPGTKVDVRVDFLDSAGNPVTINSNFTFRDVDYYGNDNKEGVTFDTTDITHYAVSGSPSSSVQVDDRGDEIEFTTDTGGDTGDENLWTQVFFENQSSLNFTLESRDNDAGYGFDTANFSNTPIITEVDASGDDLLYGGEGNDSALGGGGDDTIYGEAGEDTLDGGKGADTLFGGDGNDSVLGDAGDDTLYGNAGNDTLDGGEGTDTLFGGDGQDTFIGSDGADSISGGTGQDTVDYSASGSGVTVDLSAGTATGGDAAGDQLTGVDGVIGSDHADTIIGFDGESTGPDGFTNVFYGGTGNDSLDGRGGSDSLFGGDGSDNIEGGSGNDSIDGGDDADTIAGGIGDDSIDGGTGADSIDAGSGNDTVLGGTGADVITGGAGNDSIDAGNSGDSIDAGTGHDVVTAGSGSDTVYAGDGNDSIDGGADDDTISAGSGDDVVEGGSGSDSIDAGTGNDTILAGADQDLVYAGVGDDSIDGGSGSDSLFAGSGADTIDGGSGTDTIYAGDGNDTIDGGEGGDTLYGGDGDDKIVMDESSGIDNVFGGDGLDHLDLSGSSSGVTVDLSSAGATVTAGSGQATFDGIEEITLTSGADTVINNGYTDDINIDLGTGNDVLQSGAGDDTISGGAGNDTIDAGSGSNIVTGGTGSDTYVIRSADFSDLGTDDEIRAAILDMNASGIEGWKGIKGEGGTQGSDEGGTSSNAELFDVPDIGKVVDDALEPLMGKKDAGDAEKIAEDAIEEFLATTTDTDISAWDISEVVYNALLPEIGIINAGIAGLSAYSEADDQIDLATIGDPKDLDPKKLSDDVEDTLEAAIGKHDAKDVAKDVEDALDALKDTREAGNDPLSPDEIADAVYDVVNNAHGPEVAELAKETALLTAETQLGVAAGSGGTEPDPTNTLGDEILARASQTEITDFELGSDTLDFSNIDYLSTSGLSTNDVKVVDTAGDGSGDAVLNLPDGSSITLRGISVYDLDPETLETMGFNASADATQFQNEFLNEAGQIGGGGGDDAITGSERDETISGGSGNDTLILGGGTDSVSGGSDEDRIIVEDGFDGSTIDGGGGGSDRDEVDFSDLTSGVTLTATMRNDGSFNDANGDTANFADIESVTGTTSEDIIDFSLASDADDVSIDGGDGNDSVAGGGGNDTLVGGLGDDTAAGGDGSDLIYGGEGDDRLSTGLGEDTLYGGAGDDLLTNSAGNDTLVGGVGNDTLIATLGDDHLYGGDGNDSLDGGADDDALYGGIGDDTLAGGTGDDMVIGGDGADLLYGGAGDDFVIASDFGPQANTGNETVYGGAGNDIVTGSGGDDTIYGGTGNDRIESRDGTDTIYSGDGDDTLVGYDATALTGGDLTPLSDDGSADTFFAGSGADLIHAGDGNDVINAGTDADVVYAGDDQDTIVIEDAFGADNIYGGEGGTDIDTLDLSAVSTGVTATFSASEDGTFSDGTDTASFFEIENIILTDSDDVVDATNDTAGISLHGRDGNDTIVAGTGDDIVLGGSGNDSIDGGAGNDSIDGGAGDDTLSGGAGNDTLTGGSGNDVFELSASGGDDTITDFSAGSDTFDTTALTDVGNALTNQDGIVTAEEVVVTQPGGPGTDQLLSFPSGETVSVPDGTVNTFSTATQFASLVAMGVPPCFAPGTLIATSRGEVRVENLRIGDMIMTARNGPQPLRWIGVRTEVFADRDAGNKPILIRAGALGDGFPTRDLVVSPQHRMLMTGNPVKNMFDESQVFATAKNLTALPGVRCMLGKSEITYYALLLDRHEIIFAEGTATESFRPGPVVMRGFEAQIREEIYAIYPKLRAAPVKGLGEPAARLLNGRESRAIARRIAKRLSRRDDDISAGKRSSDDGQVSEKEQISAP
ncbi:MAG: Hint domain-containing protein [Pseudomonadota bacterium]